MIELLVRSSQTAGRRQEPVSIGVPFPRGRHLAPRFVVRDRDSRPLTTQSQVLDWWPDGSIRWALIDFLAGWDDGDDQRFTLEEGAAPESHAPLPSPDGASGGRRVVEAGLARFEISERDGTIEGRLAGTGAGIRLGFVLTDRRGSARRPRLSSLALEAAGPVRVTLRMQGALGAGAGRLDFDCRISVFPGTGLVSIEPTLRNSRAARHPGGVWDLGDPGAILFRDFTLHAAVNGSESGAVTWRREPGAGQEGPERHPVEIVQESSGGENWASRNHVNRQGEVPHRHRGYHLRAASQDRGAGLRAQPVVSVRTADLTVSGTIEHFWENFPKALEGDGRSLRLRLFPRQYPDVFELQGGEQKTHKVWLQLGPGHDAGDARPLEWVHSPLVLAVPTDWLASTGVLPQFCSAHADGDEHRALLAEALDGPQSFAAKREVIDEYGWRHFGDVYADHENTYFAGARPVVSHYNNQYDLIHGFLLQFLRSGDARWFELGRDLARHVIDVDIYHTQDDRPAYSGGLFWHTDHYQDAHRATHRTFSRDSPAARSGRPYGGGPSNEHNYTSGLLLYHFLTGDRPAREAVLGLAGWVRAMDDGARTLAGVIDPGPTGRATATHSIGYHGPGRGAGNSINALLDAFRLTGERAYRDEAERLIRRCIHPDDDRSGALAFDDLEARWSYLVFLQVLGKYLDLKADRGELDAAWAHARASLLAYAHWMLEHETPYLKALDRVEFPTETWPAHDLRKSEIFGFAAKYGDDAQRARFLEASAGYFEAAFDGLARFETRRCTRPLAIVLQSGATHGAWRSARGPAMDPPAPAPGPRPPFVPQTRRVRALLGSPGGVTTALRRLARPAQVPRLGRRLLQELRWRRP